MRSWRGPGAVLGRSWGGLGAVLGRSWGVLGGLVASWRGLAAILERLGAVLVAIGRTTKNIEKPLVFSMLFGGQGGPGGALQLS